MLQQNFILIAAVLNLIGCVTYALSTLRGNTKPNRVTWFLWATLPMIAFFAQKGEGVGLSSVFTFTVGFGPMLVLIASFMNKKAYWKILRLDYICGSLSVLAVVLWLISGNGLVAITLIIVADLLAAIPTVIKSFVDPESEHPTAFRNSAISAVITMLTIKNWTFAAYSYPIYIFIICSVLYTLIRFKLGIRLRKSKNLTL